MYPQINSLKVYKMFLALYSSMKRVEIHFLMSNVSMGNITLCRQQHTAHRLRAEWTGHRAPSKDTRLIPGFVRTGQPFQKFKQTGRHAHIRHMVLSKGHFYNFEIKVG